MDKTKKTICVYCGSSNSADQKYKDAAIQTGEIIAREGRRLVYGGGRVGLMGLTADAVLENGGEVVGIIPEFIQTREVEHRDLTELHIVETMHERKKMMVDHADVFICLPGGLGTLDETFEIMTWKQLGLHNKPIIIANINGYWDHLIALAEGLAKEKFMRAEDLGIFDVIRDTREITDVIKNAKMETFDPSTKWI